MLLERPVTNPEVLCWWNCCATASSFCVTFFVIRSCRKKIKIFILILKNNILYTHIVTSFKIWFVATPGPIHCFQKRVSEIFTEETVNVERHAIVQQLQKICQSTENLRMVDNYIFEEQLFLTYLIRVVRQVFRRKRYMKNSHRRYAHEEQHRSAT